MFGCAVAEPISVLKEERGGATTTADYLPLKEKCKNVLLVCLKSLTRKRLDLRGSDHSVIPGCSTASAHCSLREGWPECGDQFHIL